MITFPKKDKYLFKKLLSCLKKYKVIENNRKQNISVIVYFVQVQKKFKK